MITSPQKRYLLWAAIAVSVFVVGWASFSFVKKIEAQVVVSNPPISYGGGSCMLGQQIIPGSQNNVDETIYAIVQPNGTMTAITGSYNMHLNCTEGDSSCDALTAAAKGATTEGNSLGSDFPQYTDGASNNYFQVDIGNDDGVCGNNSNLTLSTECEYTTSVTQNGVTQVTGHIYFNTNGVDFATEINNPAMLMSYMEHEMTHGFGYDDTYNKIANDSGLMGAGAIGDPPITWKTDPLLADSIKETNTGKATLLGPATGSSSCTPLCLGLSVATNINGDGSYTCVPILGCTKAQRAVGGYSDPSGLYGCEMPVTAADCYNDPTDPSCAIPPAYCNSGYTWDSKNQACESASGAVTTNCECVGNNLSCTLANGSIVSSFNASCQSENVATSTASTTTSLDCNPDDPAASPDCPATPGSPEPSSTVPVDCTLDSSNPSCSTSGGYCSQNPTDADCVTYCESNPTDADCSGNSSLNNPDYCVENPTDPSCSGNGSTVSGGGGGGGGGDEGDCVFFNSCYDMKDD